jgi:MFS family permease
VTALKTPFPRAALIPLAAFVAMGLFWGAWAALVPEVQQRLGASLPELGAALLWAGAGALPAMLLTGKLWPRLGPRLVTVTLAAFGLVTIGPAIAPSVLWLAVALAAVGASSGALDVAMNSHVSDIESATGRRLMYLAHALFSLAVLVMSVTAGLLRGAGVGAVPILSAVALVFIALVVAALRATRAGPRPGAEPRPAARDEPGVAISRRAILLLGLLCAVAFMIEDGLVSWSALHLERTLGAEPAVGGAGPGLFAGAMFVGRSLGQFVSRRLSDRALLVLAGTVCAVGIITVALAPSSIIVLGGLVVAGMGVSLVAPALFSRAGRLAGPGGRGAAIAGLTAFGYLGFVVGPPLVGLIAGLTDLRFSFAVLAALALALGVVARLRLGDVRPAVVAEPGAIDELPPVSRA